MLDGVGQPEQAFPGTVLIRIEPIEQVGARAPIDDALSDLGETVRVGDAGKVAGQCVADRGPELACRLPAQQFPLRRKGLRKALAAPLLDAPARCRASRPAPGLA